MYLNSSYNDIHMHFLTTFLYELQIPFNVLGPASDSHMPGTKHDELKEQKETPLRSTPSADFHSVC